MSGGSYDRAITVFSPDGHLFQVEYANEAVKKGSAAVGVCGKDAVVLAVEKKSLQHLQESRTMHKISQITEHIALAFSGLTADAQILVDKARIFCQSVISQMDDTPTVQFVSTYLAKQQQEYTQRGGRRPFGIATLVAGFDPDGTPHLFSTAPSGVYSEWKANCIGRSTKSVKEYLENHYPLDEDEKEAKREQGNSGDASDSDSDVESKDTSLDEAAAIKLAVSALLEIVDNGASNIDVCVVRHKQKLAMLDEDEVKQICEDIANAEEV